MTQLIEIKNKIIHFFCNYEFYMMMMVKFVLALVLFLVINANIGYMDRISSLPVAIILALICCLLPVNGTICIAAIVILLDMYELCIEAALVALILFVIIYLLYFRFTPRDGIAAILTPITFRLNISYLMPMATGLLRPAYSIASIICGTILYYFIDGVRTSASSLSVATSVEDGEGTSKINIILGQISGNKEMILTIAIFVLTFIIVYLIRKMSIEHAWVVAIISGTVFELVGLMVGYLMLNISGKMIGLIIGSIISMAIAFLIQFFVMDLDYARTERVQFSDDEYYYYVKAVPKKLVASSEKTVKRFSATGSLGKKLEHANAEDDEENIDSRKAIAKELEIDEDLLK